MLRSSSLLMKTNDTELRDARSDLAKFLAQLPPDDIDDELMEVLRDMNRDGALAFRWDARSGLPIRLWYALTPDFYAHRMSAIEVDLAAILGELFLSGDISFSARPAPPGVCWHLPHAGFRKGLEVKAC